MKQMGNFVINDLVMTRFACYRRFWEVWRDSLIRAEQTKTFHHQWFGDFNVLPRFHGDPSWKNTCIRVWTLWFLAGKEFWWHASSPLSFENFTMEVVKIQMSVGDVLSPFCMLEGQVMRVWAFQRWDIGFACMETSFKPMSFFWNKSKTNNLYKRVFDVFLPR